MAVLARTQKPLAMCSLVASVKGTKVVLSVGSDDRLSI
jgi:hypothetical protein